METGRPNKYETHVKSRFDDIKKWLANGATEKEIADHLSVSYTSWKAYKNKFHDLYDLVKNNRKLPVEEIKAAMLKRAVGFQFEEKKVIKQQIEFSDYVSERLMNAGIDVNRLERPILIRTEITTKTALPDPTSGLILLKHWDKEAGWTADPATLRLKIKELELKEKQIENESW